VDDLYYLDEQLYRSLMQLKHFANAGGDVESLELYFEVINISMFFAGPNICICVLSGTLAGTLVFV
jgi:hypothetical protein